MRSFKQMLLLGLLSILAALAFAISAQASNLKGECIITGEAKTFDKNGVKTPVPPVLGSGKYVFDSLDILCVGLEKGAPTTLRITASSSGWYDSIVCGTGKAYSDRPRGFDIKRVSGGTKPLSFYEALLEDEKYKITFRMFVGEFYWHDWDKPDTPDPKDTVGDIGFFTAPGDSKVYEDTKGWDLAGTIQLTAPTQKPPSQPCADAFTAAGVIAIDES